TGADFSHHLDALIAFYLSGGTVGLAALAIVFINPGAAGHFLQPDPSVLDVGGFIDDIELHHLGGGVVAVVGEVFQTIALGGEVTGFGDLGDAVEIFVDILR